jgi:FPC/CPF motif-containing protein YcgG
VPDLAPHVADPELAPPDELTAAMVAMVTHEDYPCLGARSVMRRERATIRVYDELGSPQDAAGLLADLADFASGVDLDEGFASFVAVFRGPVLHDEGHFEALLWAHLRAVHAADEEPWAPGVSADPQDAHFAFSAGGTAYFVVGLHPQASRDARRAAVPTLVFNLHEQFEALRASGGFERMRDRIRARDEQLQGSVNPMVRDHGESSEARQYAGRVVGDAWVAPFEPDPALQQAASALDEAS